MSLLEKIVRFPDVVEATGLSRRRIYELIEENRFPRPIKLSDRAVGWPKRDIEDWQKRRLLA